MPHYHGPRIEGLIEVLRDFIYRSCRMKTPFDELYVLLRGTIEIWRNKYTCLSQ